VQEPLAVAAAMFCGHTMTGFSPSFTVTRNVHVRVKPAASVARHSTVVIPFGKTAPLWPPLMCTAAAPVQLSVTVGVEYVTTAEQKPESVFLVRLAGQAMLGNWLSFTVTVKPQDAEFTPSLTCHDTSVTPFGKAEPEASPLVRVSIELLQLSENVGVV